MVAYSNTYEVQINVDAWFDGQNCDRDFCLSNNCVSTRWIRQEIKLCTFFIFACDTIQNRYIKMSTTSVETEHEADGIYLHWNI